MQHSKKVGDSLLPTVSVPFHPKNHLAAIGLGFKATSSSSKIAPAQTEKINIAMGFDAGYAIHSLTTLASLFGNTKTPQNLEIYLLNPGDLPQSLQEKFRQLAPSPKQIHFIEVNDRLLETLPVINSHITLATYYRLLLPDLIKEPKILWIDGDTIICDDIAELWQEDLTDFPLGGVPDLAEKQEKKRLSDFYRTVKRDDSETYVNGGVSLYNLDLIRKIYPNFLISCQAFVEKYPNIIQLEDQDLLNLLFVGKVKRLPLKWNLYSSFFFRPRYLHFFSEDEVTQALLKPGLIHYASPWNKPWKAGVRTKTKGLYWYWRDKIGLPPKNIKERIAKILSPCYYLQKSRRNFLQTSFGLIPWFKVSTQAPKAHLGKWQGFFLEKPQMKINEKQ